jgi:acyl dehydratase
MSERYLEDFAVGQVFGSGRLVVDEERIKAFAAEFDPQPGWIKVRTTTLNQNGDAVQVLIANLAVPRRPA